MSSFASVFTALRWYSGATTVAPISIRPSRAEMLRNRVLPTTRFFSMSTVANGSPLPPRPPASPSSTHASSEGRSSGCIAVHVQSDGSYANLASAST